MEELKVTEILTEVAKAQATEIYQDGLKGATVEGGQALQTIVGLFNNVVLHPLKKANLTYKYKLEQFEKDLKIKINRIEKEKIIEAPISIVGPTIESLKYTIDNPNVRELYLNLLVSSMDFNTIKNVHPSFVEIIKQMSPLDAQVLKRASQFGKNIKCSRVTICFDTKYFTYGMPKIFAPDLIINEFDPFLVSASIENLIRLGLIKHFDVEMIGEDYSYITEHEYVKSRFNLIKNNNPDKNLHLKSVSETLMISDFGENFIIACVQDK